MGPALDQKATLLLKGIEIGHLNVLFEAYRKSFGHTENRGTRGGVKKDFSNEISQSNRRKVKWQKTIWNILFLNYYFVE